MEINTLKDFTTRLKAFADGYETLSESIIREHSDDLADLQSQQLAKGLNSLGQTINPPYANYTIEQKKKKSGLAGVYSHPTLFDTGQLYKDLHAKVSAGKFYITANNYKFPKLEEHYGVRVFGLTIDSKIEFRDSVALPEVQKVFVEEVIS